MLRAYMQFGYFCVPQLTINKQVDTRCALYQVSYWVAPTQSLWRGRTSALSSLLFLCLNLSKSLQSGSNIWEKARSVQAEFGCPHTFGYVV